MIGLALDDRPEALAGQRIPRRDRLRGPLGQRRRTRVAERARICSSRASARRPCRADARRTTSGRGTKRVGPSGATGRGSRARTASAASASPSRPVGPPGPSGRPPPSRGSTAAPLPGRERPPRRRTAAAPGAEGAAVPRATRCRTSVSPSSRIAFGSRPRNGSGTPDSLPTDFRRTQQVRIRSPGSFATPAPARPVPRRKDPTVSRMAWTLRAVPRTMPAAVGSIDHLPRPRTPAAAGGTPRRPRPILTGRSREIMDVSRSTDSDRAGVGGGCRAGLDRVGLSSDADAGERRGPGRRMHRRDRPGPDAIRRQHQGADPAGGAVFPGLQGRPTARDGPDLPDRPARRWSSSTASPSGTSSPTSSSTWTAGSARDS